MKKIFYFAAFCLSLNFAVCAEKVSSVLEVIDVQSGERRAVREFPRKIEAPNWTPDGKWLVFNSGGKIYKISPAGDSEPVEIPTGFAKSCNNDHVLSADGSILALSHHTREDGQSRVYVVNFEGGTPSLITPVGPSYLHGVCPKGKFLVYCGGRKGNYDVYKIPLCGGEEIRLTDSPALDDGPEYSPDGGHIWFNSCRSGLMQLWRMNPDGSNQTQMTFDKDRNSWFAHISPDGKTVAFLAYSASDVKPDSHPANKNVELRVMPASGGEPKTVARIFGGQGTINVNSWAPDSRRLAFVSYKIMDAPKPEEK
ncbi:MAG: TolB family protein [Opitutales bacterium]|nr:TolB family protein [Opitutales bacterium]